MRTVKCKLAIVVLIIPMVVGMLLLWSCTAAKSLEAGHVRDEALRAGRDAASFPAADEDYFRDMDYGITKNPEAVRAALDPYVPGIAAQDAAKRAVRGRNNWIVW